MEPSGLWRKLVRWVFLLTLRNFELSWGMTTKKSPARSRTKPKDNTKVKEDTIRRKNRMLKALADTKGNISAACDRVGVDRITHYRYMENDPAYASKVKEVEERLVETIESLFIKSTVKADDRRSMKWILERLNRARWGKVETHELSGPGGEPIRTEGTITVATLRQYIPDQSLCDAVIDMARSKPRVIQPSSGEAVAKKRDEDEIGMN